MFVLCVLGCSTSCQLPLCLHSYDSECSPRHCFYTPAFPLRSSLSLRKVLDVCEYDECWQHCWSHLLRQPWAGLMFVGRAGSGGLTGQCMVAWSGQHKGHAKRLRLIHFNKISIVYTIICKEPKTVYVHDYLSTVWHRKQMTWLSQF